MGTFLRRGFFTFSDLYCPDEEDTALLRNIWKYLVSDVL